MAHDAGALVLVDGAQAAPKLPRRRRRARRRLLRVHRPQALRPDRDRRALGAARPARRDAALPRRRLDDPQGHQGGDDLRRPARRASRPAPRRSRRRSAGCGAALARRARDGRGRSPTSARSPTYALERLAEVPGLRVFGPPALARARRPGLVRARGRPRPRRRRDPRPPRRRGPRRPPLRPAADGAARRRRDGARELRRLHDGRGDRPPRRGPARRPQGLRARRDG